MTPVITVFVFFFGMPKELAVLQWQSIADAEFSIFVPYFTALVTETDELYHTENLPSKIDALTGDTEGKINTTATGEYDINHTLIDLNTHEETYLTGKFYFNKGKIEMGRTDIVSYNGSWVYVSDGQIDWNANTVAKNQNGWWYVNKGMVDFNANSIYKNNNGWWYVKEGKVDFDYTGIARNKYGDWYIKGGKAQMDTTGVVYSANKKHGEEVFDGWYYVEDGKVVI